MEVEAASSRQRSIKAIGDTHKIINLKIKTLWVRTAYLS